MTSSFFDEVHPLMSCFTEASQKLHKTLIGVQNSRGVIRDLLTILTQPF